MEPPPYAPFIWFRVLLPTSIPDTVRDVNGRSLPSGVSWGKRIAGRSWTQNVIEANLKIEDSLDMHITLSERPVGDNGLIWFQRSVDHGRILQNGLVWSNDA